MPRQNPSSPPAPQGGAPQERAPLGRARGAALAARCPRLFPATQRPLGGLRQLQILLRSGHVLAMTVLVAQALGAPSTAARSALAGSGTLLTGLGLLGIELYRSGHFVHQGAGLALWAKLALLGAARWVPGLQGELLLLATLVAAWGSHMTRGWRHYSPWLGPEPKQAGRGERALSAAAGPGPGPSDR